MPHYCCGQCGRGERGPRQRRTYALLPGLQHEVALIEVQASVPEVWVLHELRRLLLKTPNSEAVEDFTSGNTHANSQRSYVGQGTLCVVSPPRF